MIANLYAQAHIDGPILLFGGPYSNLHATQALLLEAKALGIPPSHIVCTGDLTAYCGSPAKTIELIRQSGIHVVRGNCDEQLALSADDCGCGFEKGSACDRASAAWFAYANGKVTRDQRAWLSTLPHRVDIILGRQRLAVIHGGVDQINRFVFASTPAESKTIDLERTGCDGIIAGHCGLPFTQIIRGRLWHNPGVIGMPANDGTSRVWYSVLTPVPDGIQIEHRALTYDYEGAAREMCRAGLPSGYREALSSGIWPTDDVLPSLEREAQGSPLLPCTLIWPSFERAAG